jgi:hypothetical protein
MKPAKRLSMITVRYMGPYSPQLFESLFIANDYADFEEVAIATGESKAVAAARAISHLHGQDYRVRGTRGPEELTLRRR